MRHTQIPGHGLLNEGAAFDTFGHRAAATFGGTHGPGHGKCSCGVLSPPLASGHARRRWHAAHKDAITAVPATVLAAS